jgi:hypothetical protein
MAVSVSPKKKKKKKKKKERKCERTTGKRESTSE